MSYIAESLSKVVQPAREVLLDAAGVNTLHVPAEALHTAKPGALASELPKMHGLGYDPAAGFVTIPTEQNSRALQGLVGELVAVAAKDSQGNDGVFPGIILPQGKGTQAGTLRIGIVNGAPGKDYANTWHEGDRLALSGAPTGDQVFFLRRMIVTEAPSVGAHGSAKIDVADMADLGVSIGMLTNRTWQQNPHGKAHLLAGTETQPGTGLSQGLSVEAGLTSVDRYRPQTVVTDPEVVLWNPSFGEVQSSLPALAGYSESELTMAAGYAVVARKYGADKAQKAIAAGITAMQASGVQ